jgi:LytS/YehU family sensor histidine kinase
VILLLYAKRLKWCNSIYKWRNFENGIKHGVSKRNGNSEIHLIVKCTKSDLSVKVRNSGSIQKNDSRLGAGLQLVNKRLKAFYNQVEMELHEVGELVIVSVMARV